MKKVTKKFIRNLANKEGVCDITSYKFKEVQELSKLKLEKVYYSTGTYGISGGVLKDKNNKLYVITERSSALFQIF